MEELIVCERLGDLPELAADRWKGRPALVLGDQTWTYKAFSEEVNKVAASLQAMGISKGDRVGIWMTNCPEIEFLIFAVARVGATVVPFNTRYRASDLAYVIKASGCVALFSMRQSGPVHFDGLLAQALGAVTVGCDKRIHAEGAPALRHIISIAGSDIDGAMDWNDFCASSDGVVDLPDIASEDPVLLVYTSGTTGHPKGVLLNHSGVRVCHDRCVIMELTGKDVQLTYLPLFHTYAICYSMIMAFQCGGYQVLMEAFDADKALDLIEAYGVTVVHGFDAHFNDFLLAMRRKPRNISSLRFGTMTVGSDASIPLAREVQQKLCPTLSGYGMTEQWGAVTITPQNASGEQRCAASGVPQPGVEIRIVDPVNGQMVPAGTLGEIQIRSYSCMIGYDAQPDATAAVIDKKGWFRTGDAGIMRDDGHVRFLARYKDILKVGGENVSPAEIEGFISTMLGVDSVAVVGGAHLRLQEAPVAFIVRSEVGPRSEEEVIGFCRGKLASFKIPVRVIFVDQLPVTPTGKVQKELLRQRLVAEHAA
ncbi:AMP-dependent synthetase and ligase [Pusillimonas sp. T7-7]|uniref:class I adenylate-forming enzyme family protein n=1 Tax=Pusillimonas sp. (strain T7-7) TaxID=1007105 RepID=UPI0002084F62|nr:class I adenylate-forming enzyme family protein [Pusillimonas sp. T7-7]AEC21222.1 AMP-dependent synthetase and ligase [Pusillimonas sp. T7-7]